MVDVAPKCCVCVCVCACVRVCNSHNTVMGGSPSMYYRYMFVCAVLTP